MHTHRRIPRVLWLLTLSACSADPVSAPDPALAPAPISTGGGAGGATAAPPAAPGGTVSTGGTATGGAPAAPPSSTAATPPVPMMVPDYTPEKFCGMVRVDEGGAIVMAGCEKNVRVIYELNREQIDNGAWHSTDYGIEAPCNEKGTFRAQVSDAVYDAANHLQSYYFLIHEQGGYEFAGVMALGFDTTKVTTASGSVQGNSCTFSVCAAADCGVLDTSMLSTVRGDAGAGSGGGAAGSRGGSGGSASVPVSGLGGTAGRGGAGGRGGGGSGGRATGGVSFGFPPP